ncbi:PadR family transcriptional regulator [Micromonospora carbonacea]|jgi:DNA-binding PadR family transcriptional regulator|nr:MULTISPECIES: helix-turn-helix transcriptional regulator [Micromonospora]MBB5824049.1 DNA-binding PadR family transcriptional regulator [Micromonospora carbonacea]MDG4815718.1 helix-turn-helix transcriptional regulator [Micromonospora sp. WMMD956]WFE58269.1 helix-turn-helix transcriptional regulator [Micromonospora sp. WMMD712]
MSTSEVRMTLATQRVLRVLLDKPAEARYGLQICEEANLASGTIHPILARLEKVGWLESHWENVDPHRAGRPRRRYYRLSPDGAQQARTALAAVEARRFRGANPALPGGLA